MAYTPVGNCPKCGAPIYTPDIWMGVTPPPSYHTCMCNPQPRIITTTTSELEREGK